MKGCEAQFLTEVGVATTTILAKARAKRKRGNPDLSRTHGVC
jgi:hypothetical protein